MEFHNVEPVSSLEKRQAEVLAVSHTYSLAQMIGVALSAWNLGILTHRGAQWLDNYFKKRQERKPGR